MLLMEAHAYLTNGLQSKERLLLLFTDSLIIAKTKYVNISVCENVLICAAVYKISLIVHLLQVFISKTEGLC